MLSDEEIWEALERPPEFQMTAVKGTNLIAVGWRDGVLRVAFAAKTGARFYRYPGVPESTKSKLANSPFPDGLFTKLVRNQGFKAEAESK